MFPGSWKKTEYANPGAMNYAFIPNMTLPSHAVGGRGTMVRDNLRVLAGQQLFTDITVPTDGYGGLVAGQFVGQPLSEQS